MNKLLMPLMGCKLLPSIKSQLAICCKRLFKTNQKRSDLLKLSVLSTGTFSPFSIQLVASACLVTRRLVLITSYLKVCQIVHAHDGSLDTHFGYQSTKRLTHYVFHYLQMMVGVHLSQLVTTTVLQAVYKITMQHFIQ